MVPCPSAFSPKDCITAKATRAPTPKRPEEVRGCCETSPQDPVRAPRQAGLGYLGPWLPFHRYSLPGRYPPGLLTCQSRHNICLHVARATGSGSYPHGSQLPDLVVLLRSPRDKRHRHWPCGASPCVQKGESWEGWQTGESGAPHPWVSGGPAQERREEVLWPRPSVT